MNKALTQPNADSQKLARIVRISMLAPIIIGLASMPLIAPGININLSADIVQTAENMLAAESSLRAKAYLSLLNFGIEVVVALGLFLLLRFSSLLLTGWSLAVNLSAALLSLLGAVSAMNAALIAGNSAYMTLADSDQRLLLTALQTSSDYTSFHLVLVLSSVAKAGFFYLFWRSRLIPRLISGWGVFASLFVASMIVSRDFVPVLGHFYVTASFMASNLIALVATSLYLCIKGVRTDPYQHA